MIENTKIYNGHTYSGVLLKACIDGYQQGRADVVKELLSIKNHCDDCYSGFCESCNHNGEHALDIDRKLHQLKEKANEMPNM